MPARDDVHVGRPKAPALLLRQRRAGVRLRPPALSDVKHRSRLGPTDVASCSRRPLVTCGGKTRGGVRGVGGARLRGLSWHPGPVAWRATDGPVASAASVTQRRLMGFRRSECTWIDEMRRGRGAMGELGGRFRRTGGACQAAI
jgi:hypothetical protein